MSILDVVRPRPADRAWSLAPLAVFARRLLPNPSYAVGMAILLPIVLLAVAAPRLPIADPLKPHVLLSFTPAWPYRSLEPLTMAPMEPMPRYVLYRRPW